MPTTTNLGLAVSSNQNDSVLEYWNKMLNETDGNFVIIDTAFGEMLSIYAEMTTQIPFTIPSSSWVGDEQGPFKVSATITLSNTLVKDNSTIEAYFEDILESAGVVLYSATQSGTSLILVFYADSEKENAVSGVLKYVN